MNYNLTTVYNLIASLINMYVSKNVIRRRKGGGLVVVISVFVSIIGTGQYQSLTNLIHKNTAPQSRAS